MKKYGLRIFGNHIGRNSQFQKVDFQRKTLPLLKGSSALKIVAENICAANYCAMVL